MGTHNKKKWFTGKKIVKYGLVGIFLIVATPPLVFAYTYALPVICMGLANASNPFERISMGIYIKPKSKE